FERGNGVEEAIGDALLLGVGRAPNVENLGLEAARVAYDQSGVQVDDRLRTTNPLVYAAGDVCSRWKFTHAADAMARIVVQNPLFRGRKKASELVIPWCTYTDPEVAHVGMTAAEAASRADDVQTLTVDLADVDRAVLDGETEGFARAHIARRGGRIRGVTVVGPPPGGLIGAAPLALTPGARLPALRPPLHPRPT